MFAPLAAHLAPDGLVVLRMPDDAELPGGADGLPAAAEDLKLAGLVCKRVKRFGDMVLVVLGVGNQ